MRFHRPPIPVVATLLACALLAGCGNSSTGDSITVSETAQPDSLDPALSYTENGWQALWLVYTPLLTYRHLSGTAGAKLIPGLAKSLPRVSDGGRRYELQLRGHLRFSDGTPVRASDVRHSLERVLKMNSPGSSFFLPIVGADKYANGTGGPHLRGVTVDDRDGRIGIQLSQPSASFANVLASDFAGVVPSTTPAKDQTTSPPAGVGAYRITRSKPNHEFVLRRNRRFDLPGVPHGRLDRIRVKVVHSVPKQTEDVIKGTIDSMQDPPDPALQSEVKRRHSDRYRAYTTPGVNYFFLNSAQPPFDDVRVRRAANDALNRDGLTRIFAGLSQPACGFIPPAVAGHRSGEPCPYGTAHSRPDLARARRLVQAAGARGAKVKVWGPTEDPGDEIVTAYVDSLRQIGLDAKSELVDFAVLNQTLGNQRTKAQAGFMSFGADYPHPQNLLFQFTKPAITPTNNLNKGNVDDPRLNAAVARLSTQPDGSATTRGWAAADRYLIKKAYVAPFGFVRRTTFDSERMDFGHCTVESPVYGDDWSSLCLKKK